MPDQGSGDTPFDDILDVYRVTGSEQSYRINASDLSSHFDLIDDYLSNSEERVHVELAETGFQNYHRKGYLAEKDQVVVYADLDREQKRVGLNELTEVVLGKKHKVEEGPAAVPVEFADGERPYQNFDLFMPTHEAVETELTGLR